MTNKQEICVADIVEKRKRIWVKNKDIRLDAELVRASAIKILSTPSLVKEIKEKPYLLIEVAFTIVDKTKKTVPFFLNEVQSDFVAKYEQFGTRKPYYVLKGRQQGFTSLITAIQLSFAIVRKNFSGFTLADRSDNTKAIFNDKARTVYQRLPDELRPTEKFNSVNELFFDKLNSSWRIATATNQVGRSRTLNFVHLSEIAFYECSLSSLQKGIGEAMTQDCFTIYETTANGYNEAKDLWDSGSCFNLFYEWWRTAEYRSAEYEYLETTDSWLIDRKKVLEELGLDKEQITWYCKKYDGYIDKNTIKQEYPCSPEEAFVSSGKSLFDAEVITNRIMNLAGTKSVKLGYFTYNSVTIPLYGSENRVMGVTYELQDIEFKNSNDGYISIQEEPRVRIEIDDKLEERFESEALAESVVERCPYVIGGDTAGTGEDYFTAKVVDCITGKTVATLRKQRIDEDAFAEQVLCLAKYYNDAVIGIEINYSKHPMRVLSNKYGYENLYLRERYDKLSDSVEKELGFLTNKQTKPIIINELVSLMRDNPMLESDVNTLREMLTFVKKDNGKMEAIDGMHDDLVMALAIAHAVRSQQETNWIKVEREEFDFIAVNFKEQQENDNFINWDDY